MALEEKRTDAKYLGVSTTGTFFERSKEEKDGFEKYVSEKTGAVSYRKNYTGISGYITGIYEREIEVDSAKIKMFNLEITDEGERYVVSTPLLTSKGWMDGIAASFIKAYKNIDKTKKLRFTCNRKANEKGYVNKYLFVSSVDGNSSYKPFYTKDSPNGMPDGVKKTLMGKDVWDFSEQTNFLYERFIEFAEDFKNNYKQDNMEKSGGESAPIENVEETPAQKQEQQASPSADNVKQVDSPKEVEDDDLPF